MRNHPEETTLLQIIQGFLDCPEIADCAPEDKDPETEALESKARSILSRHPSFSGRGEKRGAAQVPPPLASKQSSSFATYEADCGELIELADCLEVEPAFNPQTNAVYVRALRNAAASISGLLHASTASPWQTMESEEKK